MYLYNSASHKKELFQPNSPDVVKMYTCGPTVYHYAHIGNLRTYIFEDIIFITQILTISIYIFDICWCFVIYFLSWQPGDPSLHFEQLVGQPLRRKRNKNKNK